jgi:hypothetical protein
MNLGTTKQSHTDVRPFCEEGKVSLTAPVCNKCGQWIDPDIVVWG